MKVSNKPYEAPHAEIIEIEPQGILCTSAGGDTAIGGGGTQGMGMTNINWP
jgi:hypothetical protein